MRGEVEQLRARVARLSDKELLRMVADERAEYRPVALELAARELLRRGISPPAVSRPVREPGAARDEMDAARAVEDERSRRYAGVWAWAILHAFVLVPAAIWAVDTLLRPGGFLISLALSLAAIFVLDSITWFVWKRIFPRAEGDLRLEVEEARKTKEAGRFTPTVEAAAAEAIERLGLDWTVGDVYPDAVRWHVDFYDERSRLRHVVFAHQPISDRGLYAEEIARQLRKQLGAAENVSAARGILEEL
jgi:hypothetical protein